MSNRSSRAPSTRTVWEEAPAGPPKSGKYDQDEGNGKVEGNAWERHHIIICGMPGGLARRHDDTIEGLVWREARSLGY